MYREMTPEEKLEYSAEIIEAIKVGGLVASLDVVDKYQKKLFISDKKNANNKPKMSTPVEEEVIQVENVIPKNIAGEASIYADEHIPAVQEDLREQGIVAQAEPAEVKTKVLEPPKSSAPNPWGEAKVVSPGELNLQ